MMIADYISENERRIASVVEHDPYSGEHCEGERFEFRMDDAPIPVMFLPVEMKREYVIKQFTDNRLTSIQSYFELKGVEITEEMFFAFWIEFCNVRFSYDFEFFAVTELRIRDKITSEDIPFILNRGQKKILHELEEQRKANVPIRLMFLKSRQIGGSTLIQLYMTWIQTCIKKNWNSVICAHIKDASINIRAMLERAICNMTPIKGKELTIRAFGGTQNIKFIPERGCTITVGTAIEPDSVRSQDAKMVHFSEMAFFPNTETNRTDALEASIVGTIPSEPYTVVVRESTANGVGDYFYSEWEKAKKEESAYVAVFVDWFCIDIYRKSFKAGWYGHNGKFVRKSKEEFVKSLNEYERHLFENHPECTLESLNWRRAKAAEMSSETKMKQEYPASDIEAFQDSGMPVFRSDDVEAMRSKCCPPKMIGTLKGDCDAEKAYTDKNLRKNILQNVRFIEDEEAKEKATTSDPKTRLRVQMNKLKVWELPDVELDMKYRYVVAYDPQRGISEKADFGVICVIDRYWMMYGGVPEVVAEWRGHIDKDVSIWIAAQIATFYNHALLVVESNTFDSDTRMDDSEMIFDIISDCYSNLYSRTPSDKIKDGEPVKYGFNTNKSTKPMIVANYTAIIREGGYIERCSDAIDEARWYEQKKNGSFGAIEGKHDDILITRMIGLYVAYKMPLPKEAINESNINKKRSVRNEATI